MIVLLIGNGGREHALAWKMAQSNKLEKLYIAPGNAGTQLVGENISVNVSDFDAVAKLIVEKSINMVVIGPEAPLVDGITDFLKNKTELKDIKIIGPSAKGATLEGSKEFAKEFMMRHKVPTATYFTVTQDNLSEGVKHLDETNAPYVLKADGLAAGKGVLIIDDVNEAKQELESMLSGKFGKASEKVVIEQHLSGIELSVFVITDGENYVMLPSAKDYKRIGEGDTGLNTGGMGCISPVPFADKTFMDKVEQRIVKPTIDGFKKDELNFNGFVFFGLMNCNGEPYVIEYNVRMGDPETEVIMPRLKNDLIDLFEATADKKLQGITAEIDEQACVTVMLVSGGYPEAYEKEKEITKLDIEDSIVFHAGTTLKDGKVVTNGGRVISVSSLGKTAKEALAISNKNAEIITFDKKFYRTDIGFDIL